MKTRLALFSKLFFLMLFAVGSYATSAAATDPLPSWNDGPAKQAILDFVKTTTDKAIPSSCRRRTASPLSIRTAQLGSSSPSTRRCYLRSTAWLNLRRSIRNGKPRRLSRPSSPATKQAMAKFTTKDIEVIAMATHTGMTADAFQTDRQGLDGDGEASALR